MPDRPRIRVWRVAVFLLLVVVFAAWLDVLVPDAWINVPAGVAYGTFLELMVLPTFGLRWCVGGLWDAWRTRRSSRRAIGGDDV
jgi:hypothetical protein